MIDFMSTLFVDVHGKNHHAFILWKFHRIDYILRHDFLSQEWHKKSTVICDYPISY